MCDAFKMHLLETDRYFELKFRHCSAWVIPQTCDFNSWAWINKGQCNNIF